MIKKQFRTITAPIFIALAVFIGVDTASAGVLTPSGAPSNTMYTLTDIFNLSAGATTTLGSGSIPATPGSVTATLKTLVEIYNAILAQIANLSNGKIASGISAFGFTGTLFGDVNPSKVLASATYPGTIPVKTSDNAATSTSVSGTSFLLTPPFGYYNGIATVSTTSPNFIAGNIKSGVNLFGITGTYSSAPAAGSHLLKTGQITCYDPASQSGAEISCTGTGQDGELQKGLARSYTDNSNGTITDNVTGLVWQKQDDGVRRTWGDSLAYCNTNTAGLPGTGWHLPNILELQSLVRQGGSPSIDPAYFPTAQVGDYPYWSSTVNERYTVDAMDLYFSDGRISEDDKFLYSYYVLCVRE